MSRHTTSSRTRALALAIFFWGAGCASAGAREQPASDALGADRGLFGAPARVDVWRDWHAGGPPLSAPDSLDARAFDFWRVEDDAFATSVWTGLFATLDHLRTMAGRDPSMSRSLHLLMALLEPDAPGHAPRLDLTFVSGDGWEGVLCRFYRQVEGGAWPGVSMLLRRRQGAQGPDEVALWGVTGFAEGAPFSASLVQDSARTGRATLRQGISLIDQGPGPAGEAEALLVQVLSDAIWPRVSAQAYLEPQLARVEADAGPAYPEAAGLRRAQRSFEEILGDTAFLPLADDSLEGRRFGPAR